MVVYNGKFVIVESQNETYNDRFKSISINLVFRIKEDDEIENELFDETTITGGLREIDEKSGNDNVEFDVTNISKPSIEKNKNHSVSKSEFKAKEMESDENSDESEFDCDYFDLNDEITDVCESERNKNHRLSDNGFRVNEMESDDNSDESEFDRDHFDLNDRNDNDIDTRELERNQNHRSINSGFRVNEMESDDDSDESEFDRDHFDLNSRNVNTRTGEREKNKKIKTRKTLVTREPLNKNNNQIGGHSNNLNWIENTFQEVLEWMTKKFPPNYLIGLKISVFDSDNNKPIGISYRPINSLSSTMVTDVMNSVIQSNDLFDIKSRIEVNCTIIALQSGGAIVPLKMLNEENVIKSKSKCIILSKNDFEDMLCLPRCLIMAKAYADNPSDSNMLKYLV